MGVHGCLRPASFIYSYYSFEYVWSLDGLDFIERAAILETNWYCAAVLGWAPWRDTGKGLVVVGWALWRDVAKWGTAWDLAGPESWGCVCACQCVVVSV